MCEHVSLCVVRQRAGDDDALTFGQSDSHAWLIEPFGLIDLRRNKIVHRNNSADQWRPVVSLFFNHEAAVATTGPVFVAGKEH
jgi:hypothetical protein